MRFAFLYPRALPLLTVAPEQHVIPTDAIERRLNILEQRPIDYFRKGAEKAADRARANGFVLKEYDPSNYPYLDDEQVSFCAPKDCYLTKWT